MKMLGLQLLAAASMAEASSVRHRQTFDYGWRFHFGDEPGGGPGPYPGTCSFPIDISTAKCTGLEHDPNRFSSHDCMMACCYKVDCLAWQHNNRACYHGGGPTSREFKCAPDNSTTSTADVVAQLAASPAAGATAPPVPSPPAGGQRASVPASRHSWKFAASNLPDSAWDLVNAPHDFVIANATISPHADYKHGHFERNVSWYRKHFSLPLTWKESTVQLEFEGVFHNAQVFVNGDFVLEHTCGYTGFSVRLDNLTAINWGGENVISIRTDASYGSGHWFEGGGIYRPTWLVKLSPAHFVMDGVFVESESSWRSSATSPAKTVTCHAELEDHSTTAALAAGTGVTFVLMDGDTAMGSCNSLANLDSASPTTQVSCTIKLSTALRQWNVKRAELYTVVASVTTADGRIADQINITAGFRDTQWSGSEGLFLNGEHLKFRGFSHHNSFGGLGVAVAPRVSLFKVQASRALGANVWRMSHNPYADSLYDLLDRTGTMVWDENRDYGPEYANEMHDMVKSHRNHPSIVIWSFCNEYECIQSTNQTGNLFRAAALAVDSTRPLAANGNTNALDVQGHSHSKNNTFENFHVANPDVPQVLSECCSCTSQRAPKRTLASCEASQNSPGLLPFVTGSLGVWTLFDYFGEPATYADQSSSFGQFSINGMPKPHTWWYLANWAAGTPSSDAGRPGIPRKTVARVLDLGDQISASTVTTIVAGGDTVQAELLVNGNSIGSQPLSSNSLNTGANQMTWDLSPDLHSEDQTGKLVVVAPNCSFPYNHSGANCHGLKHIKGASSATECRVKCCADATCSVWQFRGSLDPEDDGAQCWMGAYSTPEDPSACTGSQTGWIGAGRTAAPPGPGMSIDNVTVLAQSASGSVLASHTVYGTHGAPPTALQLLVDVPSAATGTGSKLVLDGHDTALLRVSVLSAAGHLVSTTPVPVTFKIVSGPGKLAGVSSGDPASTEHPKGSTVHTYVGTARLAVQVSVDCVSEHMDDLIRTDLEAGTAAFQLESCPLAPIVIEASSPGLTPATVSVSTSVDLKDGALEAAMAPCNFTYTDEFVG